MSANPNLSRRNFLKLSLTAGTGLVLGFRLSDAEAAPADLTVIHLAQAGGAFEPNAYVQIAPDGTITLRVHRSEMGQGVNTAVPMIICEELDVDLSSIRHEQAPPDRVYGDQVTGGSVSISGSYRTLRIAGATARTLLIAAAAQTWGVDEAECRTENGTVIHDASGRVLTYGELTETAATLPVPAPRDVPLKDPADFRLIGTSVPLIDAPDMITGQAVYASDLQLPGMLVAVVARCPVLGGKVVSVDAAGALAVPGMRQVVEIFSGVAVVADHTWAALKGRDALQVTWDEGGNASYTTAEVRQSILDGARRYADDNALEAIYEVPFLAHATMEPMACVADVRDGACEVWAPTQDRQGAQQTAARAAGVSTSAVTVHVPLIGGAFGRRLQSDYVREAVEIAKAVGAPVKVFWTREDDIQHDFYHPFIIAQSYAPIEPGGRPVRLPITRPSGIPTGAWRSVGEHPAAFFNECFLDELATAREQDPLQARLDAHANTPREAVLRLAADKAGWGTPLPDGWGRGIAVHSTFGVTHVAMVAEVSVVNRQVRVQRVVAAVDCGTIINPDTVIAQIEGGIIFGLSAALYGEITLEGGRVQQSNFHDYPVMRMDACPVIEVHLVESTGAPTGIGEMGVPPVAPALFNAIYDATGIRIRRIPVRPADLG